MPAVKKIFVLFLFAVAAASASAQSNAFLGEINKNLPDTALAGGTWSDSYIGQLISLPPHLGIGVSAGVSRFPVSGLTAAGMGIRGDMGDGYIPLINPAIELRLGGFKLPFDMGVRFSMLPTNAIYGVDLSYRSVSVDLRYAVIEENIVLPELAVGIGWYFTSGSIGDSKLNVDFKTNVFEARVQVSKSFLIFTPYLGVTGYYALSESSYEIAGEGDEAKNNYVGSRIYGGCSFNIFLVKIDVSASYNFTTQNWGGNIGARFQL